MGVAFAVSGRAVDGVDLPLLAFPPPRPRFERPRQSQQRTHAGIGTGKGRASSTHTRTHAHTHTYTYARTHTRIHTHTNSPPVTTGPTTTRADPARTDRSGCPRLTHSPGGRVAAAVACPMGGRLPPTRKHPVPERHSGERLSEPLTRLRAASESVPRTRGVSPDPPRPAPP